MNKRTIVGVLALAAALLLGIPSAALAAETYTVNTLDDKPADGECDTGTDGCTLADAIALANSDPYSATASLIVFEPAVEGVIQLAQPLPEITDDVEIRGPGADDLAIDGQGSFRIFQLTNAGGSFPSKISGLTLAQGRASTPGGAISLLNSGPTELERVAITSSSTTGAGSHGGAISAVLTELTINGGTITGNSTTGDGAFGGAISADGMPLTNGRQLTISGSTITGNFTTGAGSHGGGISTVASPLAIDGSSLAGNTTAGDGAEGGAIRGDRAVIVSDSDFSDNRTTSSTAGSDGGAISIEGEVGDPDPDIDAPLTVSDSEFEGNSSTATGGAIYAGLAAPVGIERSTFDANQATGGGAIYTEGPALGSGVSEGGSKPITLDDSTFSLNEADGGDGGALAFDRNRPIEIRNSTFDRNTAFRYGGAIRGAGSVVTDGTGTLIAPTIEHSTITRNTADEGGGIYQGLAGVGVRVLIYNSIVTDNTANDPGSEEDIEPAYSADTNNLVGVSVPLGPLGLNGGPTPNRLPLPGSPAIDSGVPVTPGPGTFNIATPTSDQRGLTRPQGGELDIGAVEVETAPPTRIDSAPPATTNSDTPSTSFSSPDIDIDYFECSLDGGDYFECTSAYRPEPLEDGPHEIKIRAVDTAGLTGGPETVQFTVDAPPRVKIDPIGTTADRTPTITFSSTSTDVARYECAIDSFDYTECESGFSPANDLADGDHTVRVRATDTDGQTGPFDAEDFVVDGPAGPGPADPGPGDPSTPGPTNPGPTEPGPTNPGPTEPGPSEPDADTAVLDADVTAKKKQPQKGKKIKIKLKGGAGEAVTGVAKGRIKVKKKGKGKKNRAIASAKNFKLKKVTKQTEAGEQTVYKLKPKKKKDAKKIFKLLKKRKDLRANPSLRLTDEAGNSVLEKRVVRLKGGN